MSEDVQNNSTSPADTTDQSVNDVSAQTSNQPASDSIQQEATPAANLAESTEATAAEEQQPSAPQEAAKQDSSREQKQEPQTDEEESSKPAAGSSDTSENAIPENETESERAEREAKTQREILEEELKNLTQKAAPQNLLFFAPNLDEIAEQARAEREARREAEEAARRQRRLAELLPDEDEVTSRRRRRRRRGEQDIEIEGGTDGDPEDTVIKVRSPRLSDSHSTNHVTGVRGSTRLEAKKIRRRESRHSGRRQRGISEAEFLARRESVDRQMIVRQRNNRIQIGVLEDGVLAEHFVSKTQQDSLIGNVYLGKVQNVLPSMEAAFVDIGRGRNAVLYAGEVNWDVSGLEGSPRKIENALKSGDSVLVQVTKDPIGHKGARLTSQVSLPGRFLVYVPGGSMTGISRKLPDTERTRLKKILKDKLPDGAGVIVRTAAEGASEDELTHDINRLRAQWEEIKERADAPKTLAPEMLYQEPDLTIKTVRDVFNEDFTSMMVQGNTAWDSIEAYVTYMAPDLVDRLHKWDEKKDLFDHYRIEEQLQKALDRKVYLPSGGSLVIDRTEAMTVVDVNTGKFTGSGGNLEETVTKNNLEAAEEIVRQLRLRDIGGIIVIDFIDMVLESNRDLVLRRLVECLGRDRTKHQVAEVTSLGLVQMTRKRMGTGLLEVFSEPCEECAGRGVIVHDQPLKGRAGGYADFMHRQDRDDRRKARKSQRTRETRADEQVNEKDIEERNSARRHALATIAAATTHDSADALESAEPKESKNARKRKRRKQNNRRDAVNKDSQRANYKPASEESQKNGSEVKLRIGGEEVELPQHSAREDNSQQGSKDQSLTLESLDEVFDQKSKRSSRSSSDSRSADRSEKSRGRRQKQSNRDVSDSSEEQNEQATNPAQDPRFTQNSDRFEAIRAGEARARASQKAGRDIVRSDDEQSRSGEESARTDANRSEKREESRGERSNGRRRSNRRVSAASVQNGTSRKRTDESKEEPKKPLVTGVAQPGSVNGASEPSVTQTVAPELLAPAKPARKRKSRRAVSTGIDGTVSAQTVEAGKAAGVVTASVANVKAPAADVSAVMLGVGVSADEIKREGK